MTDGNMEIIGFDLGHGETALVRTRLNATVEPTPLEVGGARSIVTAVGRDANGRIAIGREVITLSSSLVESYTRFKCPDLQRHPVAAKATLSFVQGILDRLVESRQVAEPDHAYFLVGCPSGWGPQVQETYRKVLEQGGLRNVCVVPESRAAFLQARESKELSDVELTKRILLIDIGSSTTDFTFSEKLNARPVDFGHTAVGDIGAGLLDQAILNYSIDSQANQQELQSFLGHHPGKKAEVDLKCRDAKHEYFNEKQGTGNDVWQSVRLERGLLFEVSLDDAVMCRIKNSPLEELGGRSFVDAFRDRLVNAKEKIGDPPDHILVTGGGARMQFVMNLIEEVFAGVKPIRGGEPELAVAKGLAWFGRSQLKSQGFQKDVEDLVKSSKVEDIVGSNINSLFSRLAADLAAEIVRRILRDEMIHWRNGATSTLRQMEIRTKERVDAFLHSDAAKSVVTTATRQWFEEIRPRLQSLTDPICLKYQLPASTLQLSANTHFSTKGPKTDNMSGLVSDGLDQIGTIINAIVATVSAMVLGGAGVALLNLPFFGQVIAGIGVFVALMIGKEAMMEQVKDWIIPTLLRKIITEGKIDSKLKESLPDLVAGLRDGLKAAESEAPAGRRLADRIGAQIDQGLRQRGDDAVLQF